jgi:predicted esterase
MKNAEVIEPKGEHKFSMIFSHGLGDEGASFIDVFEMLSLKNTRVILPNAPVQPVTCNGGYRMPAWYDIYNLGPNRDLINDKQDEKGILESSEKILELVDAEAAKVGYKNVFIGGFSQGAAMSMFTAMRCQHELGGVIAASGYALLPAQGDANIHTKTTPMLVYHGVMDPVVPVAGARLSQEHFKRHGVTNIEYHEEGRLQHSLSQQELGMMAQFLQKHMTQK